MAKGKVRKSTKPPKDETKEARFLRVVTPRVTKAVKAIRVIGYCAGTTYVSSPAQVQEIHDALIAAVASMLSQYEGKDKVETTFAFTK